MMMQSVLLPLASVSALLEAEASLAGWSLVKDDNDVYQLEKTVRFASFLQAWGFMSQVALVAEQLNHHPHWVNCYNWVTIRLSTHDAGGITALDVLFAERVESLLGR